MESLNYWLEREEKIFTQRDAYERKMSEIVGVELTPMQVLQLRQACSGYESCEDGIERVQNQIQYWQQVRKASV